MLSFKLPLVRQTFVAACVTSLLFQPLARSAEKTPAELNAAAGAPAPKPTVKAEALNEINGLNGTNVAFLLAATCKPENWAKFAPWAKKSGFLKREVASPFRFSSSKAGVRADGTTEIAASFSEKKGLSMTYKGVTTTSVDACSAILKTFDKSSSGKSALFSALVSPANAQEKAFQEEGKDSDMINAVSYGLLGVAAISAVVLAPVAVPGAALILAAGTFGLYMGYTNGVSANSKQAFDEIMNSMLTMQCNKAGTFIKTSSYRVSVRKVPPPPRLDVYDINTGATSNFINSFYAKKSREVLLSLATRCNTAQDAEKIMKQYTELRDHAAAKVTAADEGRPVPGSEVELEKASAKTAPSRAPQNNDDDEDDDE